MRSRLAPCALFAVSLSAMELPQNTTNNNNAAPQATTPQQVPALKELCCRKLAQHIGAYCKKKPIRFPASVETAAAICKEFEIDRIVHEAVFDDLVRIAATNGSRLKHGCFVDYGCREFLHPRIPLVLRKDYETGEVYNPETRRTTARIPLPLGESRQFIVSPCAQILASRESGKLSVYDLKESMAHTWDGIGLYEEPKDLLPLCTYPVYFSTAFFLNPHTIVGIDIFDAIFALDVVSGKTTVIHKVSKQMSSPNRVLIYNVRRVTDSLFAYVYPVEKSLVISLVEQKETGEWFPPSEIDVLEGDYYCYDLPVILATHDSPAYVVATTQSDGVVLYAIKGSKRIVQKPQDFGFVRAAAFSPTGESLAIVCGSALKIYRVADLQEVTFSSLQSSPQQIIWPSYEVGILVPEQGGITFYNTRAAHVLAHYKRALEENNNNHSSS